MRLSRYRVDIDVVSASQLAFGTAVDPALSVPSDGQPPNSMKTDNMYRKSSKSVDTIDLLAPVVR